MPDKQLNIRETASKSKLVEAGKNLFSHYGFRKVSVEEVCKLAGISKMTFYRFFENKIDLVKFILVSAANEGWLKYQEISKLDVPYAEKIRAVIRMKFESGSQFSDELLKDIYEDQEAGLMSLLQQLTADMVVKLMDEYKLAQEQGHIRKDLNLKFIPYFLDQITRQLNDPALLALYGGNIHEAIMELTNFFFYGILVPETPMNHEK